jgi:hypothetical protein
MMDSGLRIPHSAMRQHLFDVPHQTDTLFLQARASQGKAYFALKCWSSGTGDFAQRKPIVAKR